VILIVPAGSAANADKLFDTSKRVPATSPNSLRLICLPPTQAQRTKTLCPPVPSL